MLSSRGFLIQLVGEHGEAAMMKRLKSVRDLVQRTVFLTLCCHYRQVMASTEVWNLV